MIFVTAKEFDEPRWPATYERLKDAHLGGLKMYAEIIPPSHFQKYVEKMSFRLKWDYVFNDIGERESGLYRVTLVLHNKPANTPDPLNARSELPLLRGWAK